MYPKTLITVSKYGSQSYLYEILTNDNYSIDALEEAMKEAISVGNKLNAVFILSFILSNEELTEEYAY